MNTIKDRYQIEETSTSFAFKPMHQLQSGLHWYVLASACLAGFSFYFYIIDTLKLSVICGVLVLLFIGSILKDIMFNIPIKYTFDSVDNAVYLSNLFVSQKKMMDLDELAIFQNSDTGSWHYRMGKKKSQFVKSYPLSVDFSDKEDDEAVIAYKQEILGKIEQMVDLSVSKIAANSIRSRYRP